MKPEHIYDSEKDELVKKILKKQVDGDPIKERVIPIASLLIAFFGIFLTYLSTFHKEEEKRPEIRALEHEYLYKRYTELFAISEAVELSIMNDDYADALEQTKNMFLAEEDMKAFYRSRRYYSLHHPVYFDDKERFLSEIQSDNPQKEWLLGVITGRKKEILGIRKL